jgi:amidase
MDRRQFLESGAAAGAAIALGPTVARRSTFELEEATLAQLQDGMKSGRFTARGLVERYFARIDVLDDRLRSVIERNPEAGAIADALDADRKGGRLRGPLHGIPVLIKDNIATADRMATTAGSLALVGAKVSRDAFVARRLREAGAVLLGKTNLSEWANFRSTHSTSGWSGRGGQCRNPYALDRNPSGSSSGSGSAVAANLCALAVGTETDGSIVSPAACCSLVGIKPTVGLVSRAGIIPIAHSQDTAGPMARSVADAAVLLGALAGVDPRDAATAGSAGKAAPDYTRFLDPNGLKGARIGVPRTKFFGYSPKVDAVIEQALDTLKRLGAVLVDPADIATAGQFDDAELEVLLYEFKADLNTYLAELGWEGGGEGPVSSLTALIAWNTHHSNQEMPYFGQELFMQAEAKGPLTDQAYKDALEKCRRLSRSEGIDAVMDKHQLDALVAPTNGTPWLIDLVNGDAYSGGSSTPPAVAGYPHITVPAGYTFGLPVGLSFFGRPWSEGTLIKLAYAYEQATKLRRPPRFSAAAEIGG